MSNMIVVPTGYMGSGSSAITDIISEFDGFYAQNSSYEYVFLHCPDGVFDLEDKLLIGNNAVRSDEAIFSFEKRMKSLFDKKNYWAGSYNHFISPSFMNYVDEFISSIITNSFSDVYWYYQQEPISLPMQLKMYCRRFLKTLTGGKCTIGIPLKYKTVRASFPTSEEFYASARVFIDRVLKDLKISEYNIILDQLLLPHNLFRIENYFDSSIKVIVVERDPRDVFLLNKYVWREQNLSVPYPLDAEEFCHYYRRMRYAEKPSYYDGILRLHFEDLVYKYQDSMETIYDFLAVKRSTHQRKMERFMPDISIKNTQIFKYSCLDDNIIGEVKRIEKELPDYLYDFPEIQVDRKRFENVF